MKKALIVVACLSGFALSAIVSGVVIVVLMPDDSRLPSLPDSKTNRAEESYLRGVKLFSQAHSALPCEESGLKLLAEAVRLNPRAAKYRNGYGVGLMQCGLLDNAILEFNAALSIDPTFSKASSNLTLANLRKEERQASALRLGLP
jgi:Flp pilus assembly protein TadD